MSMLRADCGVVGVREEWTAECPFALIPAMTQPDAQVEGGRPGVLDLILRAWTMFGFVCAAAIIVMMVLDVLGTWGLYLGSVAFLGGPTGFFLLARRGAPVRVVLLFFPFAIMMAGAVGLLVSGWTFMMLVRH